MSTDLPPICGCSPAPLGELGELTRFRRAAVANYAGLVPRHRDSDQKRWSHARGRRRLEKLLRHDPPRTIDGVRSGKDRRRPGIEADRVVPHARRDGRPG
ncbi:MAG: transposase [Planctomycetes bacterium]|nr:transposase [Planctomycetota bacterium]